MKPFGPSPTEMISAYVEAFEIVHGRRPAVAYENGWFVIEGDLWKHRARELIEMTETLRSSV